MFRSLTIAGCALTVAMCLPLVAQAQGTYTIKTKKGTKGHKTHVLKNDTQSEAIKVTDNDGAVLKDDSTNKVKKMVYDETILARQDLKKNPTALKRTYTKATVQDGANTTTLPYEGKTVVIEKKGDKYEFRYENGGEITGTDAEELDQEFNKKGSDDSDLEAVVLPKKAVAINETWTISMPEFLKAIDKDSKMTVDADKASGSGRLLKVYKKNGHQFGDVEITLKLPVKSLQTDNGEIVCQPGSEMKLGMKGSLCIDGSEDAGNMNLSMNFDGKAILPSADNPMARLSFQIRRTGNEQVTEVQKK